MTTKPKSTVKNIAKGASFTYAFRRINESLSSGYYLEAITLEESIISDRLLSFVKYKTGKGNVKTSFNDLIKSVKKINQIKFLTKDGKDLFQALDEWRVQRNTCIHSISKSEPGEPTVTVDEFIDLAKQSAITGKDLARITCEWDKGSR